MEKLILLSIILFTSIVPLVISGSATPAKTVKSLQWATLIATFIWAYLCRTWYPQLVSVD